MRRKCPTLSKCIAFIVPIVQRCTHIGRQFVHMSTLSLILFSIFPSSRDLSENTSYCLILFLIQNTIQVIQSLFRTLFVCLFVVVIVQYSFNCEFISKQWETNKFHLNSIHEINRQEKRINQVADPKTNRPFK